VTGNQFSEVDLDLLADYVGGVLDGTPEHVRVTDLVAHDPVWRSAHESLTAGMTAVESQLNALGAASEPMPADLAVRLEDAFRAATPAPRLEPIRGGLAAGRAPARPPRRRWRWAMPVAAAAAVLAVAGIGLDYLAGRSTTATDNRSSSAGSVAQGEGAPMAASAEPQVPAPPTGDQIRSTGADYDDATLAGGVPTRLNQAPGKNATVAPAPLGDVAAGPLARLRAPDARLGCLNAIATANGAGPITVQTVDYARFRGKPALVVRFSAANGKWAWASGPACGTPDAGAATLASVPVG
jgi:hypothetical protein